MEQDTKSNETYKNGQSCLYIENPVDFHEYGPYNTSSLKMRQKCTQVKFKWHMQQRSAVKVYQTNSKHINVENT